MKPKPTVELTPKAVIVTHIYGSDTLLIQGDKYYRGIPRTRRI